MRIPLRILFIILLFALLTFSAAAKDKVANYNGVKLHYSDSGKGKKVLVLVHCWSCNTEFWKDQVAAFPDHRVIALDLPGHGKSDKPETPYTMEFFARAVDAVMRDAKVKRAVLIGHSMGTPIITNFYKLYPNKVTGMVVVDGQILPDDNEAEGRAFIEQMRKNYKTVVPKFLDSIMPTARPELKTWIKTQMMANPEFVGLSAMDGLVSKSSYPIQKIDVPLLALLADSPAWPADLETKLRLNIPKLTFIKMKGVSHFLQLEKPAEFNSHVKDFLLKNKL
jgi:pimeloyl-ACP methyl ester carboxylesterase